MEGLTNGAEERSDALSAYLSPSGAWAIAVGGSIGWGSLVVTSSTYLAQAGPLGTTLGLLIGLGIMLVVAGSYHFLMLNHPGSGGVYAYARDIFGYDQGVLVAWFLALTYIAIFWANATSLPLFARFFMGGLFQFGPHYTVFGYEVYVGEALLSMAFIALAGFVCRLGKRGVSRAVVFMCAVIVVGIVACFVGAAVNYDAASFSFEPLFAPDGNAFMQVINIACISSWAFIGFESVSHSSGEFAFARNRSFKVLAVALVTVTALYVLLTLLSVMAYPETYGSWPEYIGDLGSQQGVFGIPAFYVAHHYLGDAGIGILMAVLLCLVFTSLVVIMLGLSRLLFSLAVDRVLPERLSAVNGNGVPSWALAVLVVCSLPMPFIGRTAIGWIVDVTTIGATMVYGYVSACALREGRDHENKIEARCGAVGLVLMVAFALYLLVPGFFARSSMATETFALFAVWSMLGFVFFRHLLRTDQRRRFGKTVVSWVMLLALTLFTCMAWMGQMTDAVVNDAVGRLGEHYAEVAGDPSLAAEDDEFVAQVVRKLDSDISLGMFGLSGMLVFSVVIMLSNFATMRKREEESHNEAHAAQTMANTDPLTGVKSKNAFATRERELNAQLAQGALDQIGVVVCDVNGLKQVNDTLGHKAGDEYIRSACAMICDFFKHSPVYRIGGDEFVAILQGADFENRDAILAALHEQSAQNRDTGKVVVAAGMAVLDPQVDNDIHAVFERADAAMYESKRALKGGMPGR